MSSSPTFKLPFFLLLPAFLILAAINVSQQRTEDNAIKDLRTCTTLAETATRGWAAANRGAKVYLDTAIWCAKRLDECYAEKK